jgi:ribonuclease HII
LSFAVDSKTTKKSQRAEMINKIKNSVEYCLIEIPPSDIDSKGLSLCIKGALEQIQEYFGHNEKYIYDGNKTFGAMNIETLVKADGKVISVSCASIIAKSFLDGLMERYDKEYPEYGFDTNAGYGTKKHIEAIKEHGYTPLHRLSYKVKALEEIKISNTVGILF